MRFRMPLKIFMSGSMEEFYTFLQLLSPFENEPTDICAAEQDRITALQDAQPSQALSDTNTIGDYIDVLREQMLKQTKQNRYLQQGGLSFGTGFTRNKILSLPTDTK